MTYQEAIEYLKTYNQQHILKYYEELSELEREALIKQIASIDFMKIETCRKQSATKKRGVIEPISAMTIERIEEYKEEYKKIGLHAIQNGKVGTVLLAGGMGTRLGTDKPKGMYNIGITKDMYIFERIIRNLLDVVELSSTWIHLFVMTSEINYSDTVNFFKEHKYFGYNESFVTFFIQDMAPATDYDGKVILEEKGVISMSPNGNGGWFSSMVSHGCLNTIKEESIEWINVFSVDNVLQRIADPYFVGATIKENVAVGAKVIKKNHLDEKVGVICLEDKKPSIIEYYEMTDELKMEKNETGDYAYQYGVILNYLFSVKNLEAIYRESLPIHIVEKKIPYMNEQAELIIPEKPNGYKYECLVLDMIQLLDSCLPYEVIREYEFAPIKNSTGIDSVETAQILLKKNKIEL